MKMTDFSFWTGWGVEGWMQVGGGVVLVEGDEGGQWGLKLNLGQKDARNPGTRTTACQQPTPRDLTMHTLRH